MTKKEAMSGVVNEAVELAKEYSTEESGGFINGLLSRVAGTRKAL